MADYWKSQPRHFCEFCKCWTADNKPSRDFHERGKRHQDNVKKKLDELRKKGLADAKKEKEMSYYLKKMEKGAMSKLKEDLTADPSMASQYGVILKNKRKLNSDSESTSSQPTDSNSDLPVAAAAAATADNSAISAVSEQSSGGGDWVEATTPEGYVYYWNTVTKESCWELPDIDSQPTSQVASTSTDVCKPPSTKDTTKQVEEQVTAAPAAKKPKKSKDKTARLSKGNVIGSNVSASAVSVSSDVVQSTSIAAAPSTAPNTHHGSAYGVWKEVKQDVEEPLIDLQLPENITKSVEQKPVIVTNEPKFKFREKTVASLSSASGAAASGSAPSVGFRKPKTTVQRSIRSTNLSEES